MVARMGDELEDIHSRMGVIADGVQLVNQRVDGLDQKVDRLEAKVDKIDLRLIRGLRRKKAKKRK
jgi:hypothetical protein